MAIHPPRPATPDVRTLRASARLEAVATIPDDWVVQGPSVVILIGGHAAQGDDGAPLAAAATLLPTIPRPLGARLEIRRRPLLEVEDLASVPIGERCLLVDAASGPPAGMVLAGALDDLRGCIDGEIGFLLRSGRHELICRMLDDAAAVRGARLEGRYVALTGHRWGFGTGLSPAVRDALPAFRDAIDAAVRTLAAASDRAAPPTAGHTGG